MRLEKNFSFNAEHKVTFELHQILLCVQKKQNLWGHPTSTNMQKKIATAILDNRLIPPLKFSDNSDSHCNMLDCTFSQHVERIAWLVCNWKDEQCTPIEAECDIDGNVEIINGFHRLFALAYINKKTAVAVTFRRGSRAYIEKLDGFIEWAESVPSNDWFGKGILATCTTAYRFEMANHRVAVKYITGEAIGRLISLPSRESLEVQGINFSEYHEPNVKNLLTLLGEKIDPLFLDDLINQKLMNYLIPTG